MQNRKNVSRLSIVLLTVLFVTMPLRAQVIIGDNSKDPHKFSLLEIVAKSAGGLRLPQLTDAQCAALKTFFTSGTTSSEDKAAAEGLVVYNTDVHCLFFWGEDDWVSACNDNTPDPRTYTSPVIVNSSETSQRIGVGASAMMSVTAMGEGPLYYQWYSGVVGNESFPVGAAESDSYTPTPVSASTYYYWCKVSNSYGSTNSEQFTVTVVTCGAYIAEGVWKKFMCWNLGADYSADPFEPSAALNGDYYQWGSSSPAATRYAIIGAWGSAYNASYDYGDGIFHDTTPESNNQTIKSPTDPCPDGYRIPNLYEWDGVKKNNTWTAQGTFADDGNYTSGQQVGESLFLPATGVRNKDTGALTLRGNTGIYWSSSLFPVFGGCVLHFSRNSITTDESSLDRSIGYSIRCIAE